ncbi:dermokine [Fukomys damarensis]|uniref:dermokine n=1 Tax=Fukomys damarensis TaxID=885580 RepID=UPI0014559D9F|nr:dermokine [Fukomys damarensis]
MKLLVSLSSLLLALCLGSGAAGPLQGPGTGAGQGMGEATGNGVEKAIGEGAKEAVSSGIEDAVGQGNGGEASSAFREATGDALSNKLGEAAHALENTGREAGRQAESFIRHGTDAAHSSASWVISFLGMQPSSATAGSLPWASVCSRSCLTLGCSAFLLYQSQGLVVPSAGVLSLQGTSGGHGVFGSHGSTGGQGQGSFGGPGSPWGHGQPGGSEGSFGTNSLGGSWGQGGSGRTLNLETNAQGSAAQPGYGSVRGSRQNSGCANGPLSGSGGSSTNSRVRGGDYALAGEQGRRDTVLVPHPHPLHSAPQESSSQSGGSSGGQGGSSGGQGGSSGGHGGSSGGHGGSSGGHGGGSSGSSHESDSGSSSGSRGTSGGGSKPECDYPQNEGRITGESESENSQTSPGVFNFDNFWKNFKSKLGFINWDAINKGQVLSPSTRALLYFRRLWEDFKRRTPFFNWKKITEDLDLPPLQKRAGSSDQVYYNQQAYPTMSSGQNSVRSTPKGVTTPSSSASRAQPGLLHWLKFW